MATRVAPQDPLIERLRSATSITSLVRYLHDELNWPVDLDAIDDAFYDYEPEELGIKPEHQVAIKTIKQLRPLTSGQPWGIFFVEFDKQRLPMVVLRRVLQGLSLRNREKDKGRQRWHAQDLLFISSFGPASDREIALAHFTDESDKGDLPTLRVLGWDGADTNLALAGVANTMREHLRWPSDGDTVQGQQRWRQRWSSAFRLRYREAVTTAKDLALALAYLARAIRTRANEVLVVEGPSGPLTLLFQAFKANLMADLTHDRFADMYAQTITYGLFAARVSRSSGGLVADDAALMIPSTNPFLQDLLQDFLAASGRSRVKGRARGTGIDFDELGVNAVVEQLRQAPMDAVLVSFNNARPGDDPVIHFYEDFLTAYDKAMRVERGVFYTPKPVVQFIVRSVHEVLQNEFGIEEGLASTITWGEMLRRKPGLELPTGTTADSAFVQMLDPAVGTATFLVEVIDLIHRHMLAKWQRAGQSKAQQRDSWNTYVREHLLTRLHGFELMMAPYAIAHMKIGLKLADTGYNFPEGGPRVRVFLTNSLQPASEVQPQFELMAPMLAHEARAANAVKEHLATTVVLGNPPYSEKSFNTNGWITGLMDDYKVTVRNEEAQIKSISNDYVKFIRLSQHLVAKSGLGVIAMITASGFLDGRLFRDMRANLLRSFGQIAVLDLHGSGRRGDGQEADENVFEILQGVCISLMSASSIEGRQCEKVATGELTGRRADKFSALLHRSVGELAPRRTTPMPPLYMFEEQQTIGDYDFAWPLSDVFGQGRGHGDRNISFAGGFKTRQDGFTVAFDEATLLARIEELADERRSEKVLRESYRLCTTAHFDFQEARRAAISGALRASIKSALYRPFDERPMIWARETLCEPQTSITKHFEWPNLCLAVSRVVKDDGFRHVSVSRGPVEVISLSASTSTNAYMFPLWRYASPSLRDLSASGSEKRKPPARVANLNPAFLTAVQASIGALIYDRTIGAEQFDDAPEKVLRYIYALLHSPTYRHRYADSLRTDFPRIPVPSSIAVLNALSSLGGQLVQWHLLEHPDAVAITATLQPDHIQVPKFFGQSRTLSQVGDRGRTLAEVQTTGFGPSGKVPINATSGFSGVLESVWQQHSGGYQVLFKWLDDRRKGGRSLSDEDIAHWRRIYASLQATQGLMEQVDEVIESHGGWPTGVGEGGAFSLSHPPPSADVLAAQAAARPRGRRRAAQPGQHSLLDADEEPEPAPKRAARKARTPTGRSAGAEAGDLDDGAGMCALRAALTGAGDAIARDALIRQAARALGYQRTRKNISAALDDAIRRAVRRGIAENRSGGFGLLVRDIDGYDRDHLKVQLISALRAQRGWVERAELPQVLARWLGYARTGTKIAAATESLVRALVRSGQLELSTDCIRVARA